ncbi:type II secretion system protein GspM [Phaeobacter sp. J2-8]|uniref:type II secretion system protein GspM n=1 Tax=Phaeobacter sp. J2-8 TaxID=2931394 RepID=UPI001FD02095|nr:type II secretion system protein GspM [Phaeobacter sp. J2-8]MCJ7874785.1 type II secretion system protein M [Phaeobacter sp. J2-8]
MSTRLIDMLLRLAPRERVLLGLLVLVILPMGLVMGVILPLQGAQDTALANRAQALALNLWVQDRVEEARRFDQSPRPGPRTPVGTSEIEQDLIAVGLRDAVRELSSDGDGVVALRFDNVRFTRLANWLSGLDPAWAYDISAFRFEATETSGNVAATLTLVPGS